MTTASTPPQPPSTWSAERPTAALAEAAAALGASGAPSGFADELFGRVAPEDLARYSARALADLASAALRHLAEPRRSGADCSLELVDVTVERGGGARELTIVEVINDDRPFLLDSVLMELDEQGLTPLLLAHPVLGVERNPGGAFIRVVDSAAVSDSSFARESLIHIHLDRIDDGEKRGMLARGVQRAFRNVSLVSDDTPAMTSRLDTLAAAYRDGKAPVAAATASAVLSFLSWLRDGNFVLLGIDEREAPSTGFAPAHRSLGIVRDPDLDVYDAGRLNTSGGFETAALLTGDEPLIVTKASVRSTVHRNDFLDCVGIKTFEPRGVAWIVGLFTPSAYTCPTRDIPFLNRKLAAVADRAGFDPAGHAGRTLRSVLEAYPRDELYQIDSDRLLRAALAIVDLAERPRIRVLQRPDAFGRFMALLIYLPRDRFDTAAQRRIGAHIAERFGGRLAASAVLPPDGPLARLHVIVRGDEAARERDALALEAEIAALVRTWGDELRDVLESATNGRRARAIAARYADAFSVAYRERFAPREALADIGVLERMRAGDPLAFSMERSDAGDAGHVRLKAFSGTGPLPLSDRVPVLENLGFRVIDERTYDVRPTENPAIRVWIHDMRLLPVGGDGPAAERSGILVDSLHAIAAGKAESDGYNRLILAAGLEWRDVAFLRALGRYLRQIRIRYGQDYLAAALVAHPNIARDLAALFRARLDPHAPGERNEREEAARVSVEHAIAAVAGLDEERILRRFLNLVDSIVRTNFFQTGPGAAPREAIAFKFACAEISGLPLPRPLFEIFVYSPDVEGVHLRFGRVARGGIRWSDRPQDYRTEVLGLVKAQQVKNAVIVPVGAKGGFLPKRLPNPADRAAWLAEGERAYRIYIGAMLDVTDNIVDGAIARPPQTVCRDPEDDAYLVVAADKGTATFSDIANAISIERGHWLGDAFASGGSQGYDHKAMGITARGAWEAVKRHFHEIDIDAQSDPITAVGVGDMSGDVFGNGMLLSRSLRLVAAFDHRHIFLDPDPDPSTSFAERRRLFDLPRSTWADYDRALISPGGGVFERSLKSIPLAESARRALDVADTEASPEELIQAILKAPVDLVWFGGIGAYVRASDETDEEAGDKANDAVRVTGAMLRAKVVGEGANLGLTQRGRIEAALAGVRLNTDAIDNSAGVNTSDIEVNIKIALMAPERDGRLDGAARNALLAGMTDEVATLVLRNTQLQTLALSLAQRSGANGAGFATRLMQSLEEDGRLDRKVELLPDDAVLVERQLRGEGLTRPEWAVLLAYAKLALHDALLAGSLTEDPYFTHELHGYFPAALRDRFPDAVEGHRLRREIIATALSNAIVNRGGPTLVTRLIDETGADAATIAKAYALTRDAYGLTGLNAAIEETGGALSGEAQLGLYADVQDLLADRMPWFVRTVDLAGPLSPIAARYREGVSAVEAMLPDVLDPAVVAAQAVKIRNLEGCGMSPDAARRLGALRTLRSALDIVWIAESIDSPIAAATATYYGVDRAFRLEELTAAAHGVRATDTFDHVALRQASASLAATHRQLTADVLTETGEGSEAVQAWCATRGRVVPRIRATLDSMASSGMTIAKAVVAANLLGELAGRQAR